MGTGTIDTRGGELGGGAILDYIGKGQGRTTWFVDYALERAFLLLPYIRILITALILLILAIAILRAFNIKRFGLGKGIHSELQNINAIKARDRAIMRSTAILTKLTSIVEKTPFRVAKLRKEYLDYNLARAGIMAPGGYRPVKAEEFNGIIQAIQFVLVIGGAGIAIFRSAPLGVIIIFGVVMACTLLPKVVLRSVVMSKDNEIRHNFSEMYLMIHYTLISGAQTPLDKVLRSYGRTTESTEMRRFVNNCCNRIDTYGEYHATRYITKDYREIAEVAKLMRLIRQLREGGDIKEELIGFREELIIERRIALEKKGEKLVANANRSMIVVWIVLIQVVISAMAIYLPDLGVMTGSFGLG